MKKGKPTFTLASVSGFAVMAVILFNQPCIAQESPAITGHNLVGTVSGLARNITEGWRFTANSDIQVMRLGVWDLFSDGLNASHDIGLWDASGNLLASATVPGGTAAALINDFRYVSITPVALDAGHDYLIGALYVPSPMDDYLGGASGNTFTSDPRITWRNRARYSATAGAALTFPSETAPFAGAFGPNFTLTPEPATLSLLALGGLALLLRRKP